jgi:ATP-binding cassette subfamily B protein
MRKAAASAGPIESLLGQPEDLPSAVAEAVRRLLPNEPIRVFALADLDARRRFVATWLVVTDAHVVIAAPKEETTPAGPMDWTPTVFPIAEIESVETFDGLACCWMTLCAAEKRPLATVQYTRRQSRAIGNVQFAAEQIRKRQKESGNEAALAKDLDPATDYREAVLKAVKDAKASLLTPAMGVMLRLLSYMRPHRKTVALGFATSILMTLVMLTPPYLTRVLVDDILRPVEQGTVTEAHAMRWLWITIGALAGMLALSEALSFIRMRVMAIVGEKIAMKLREDVYSHMQKLSLSFFGSRPTGTLVTRVSSDTDRLWDFITFGFIDMVMAGFQILGVAVALVLQDWSLALAVLAPVPVMVGMFYFYGERMQVLFLRIWRKWSAMTAVLSDVIPGIRVVKAFAQEEHEIRRFNEKNLAVEQEAEILHREWTRFWPRVVMLMHTCTLIVWAIGAPRVLRHMQTGGVEGMPLGIFLAFVGYMWMFWEPVQRLGMMSRVINRVTTSASRVFEVLDTAPTIANKPDALPTPPLQGRVAFDNVTFSYDGVRNVLRNVSFEVAPGEMIGLVGPSGGGKTTLVNLICRFYDVKDGAIRIDGHDVRDFDVASLRRQIGVVLQEPYLFHGTVAENIAYGSHGASRRDVIEAARAANAHEFICGFPDGYETVVGERGQTLSGGERQRVSIARAILHSPRILILDEATSSVDTETEKKIQEALKRLVSGRTTFAIAHRLSTLSAANRLFVLEAGRLVEHGTHAELLAKPDGLYAKLHKTQMELHAAIAV